MHTSALLSHADAVSYRMMMTRAERITGFVSAIWEWYGVHKRTLPWRDMAIEDADERAYRVLVSEVMLQQTQVSRVQIVFKDFLERFPLMENLASATNTEVILAWRGMGYNSRALRLRDAARTVVREYGGMFPRGMEELLSIKGLGPYTASAIRNFAFDLPTPCIDTNIRRILHRTFIGPENPDGTWSTGDKELFTIADDVLSCAVENSDIQNSPFDSPSRTCGTGSLMVCDNSQFSILNSPFRYSAANWHAALMDYGSLVQTKNNPKWDVCILTARGIMMATPENWIPPVRGAAKERLKKEPGRTVGGVHIPNRIFRGKIVEALRDAKNPLPLDTIGSEVCIDWTPQQHRVWLQGLVDKLVKDELIRREKRGYMLA